MRSLDGNAIINLGIRSCRQHYISWPGFAAFDQGIFVDYLAVEFLESDICKSSFMSISGVPNSKKSVSIEYEYLTIEVE